MRDTYYQIDCEKLKNWYNLVNQALNPVILYNRDQNQMFKDAYDLRTEKLEELATELIEIIKF